MAAVTVTQRFMASEGPIRKEVAQITIAADQDTFVTQLQNPDFGFFVGNTDTNSNEPQVNLSFSGRTVTFNSSAISTTSGVVTIYGF